MPTTLAACLLYRKTIVGNRRGRTKETGRNGGGSRRHETQSAAHPFASLGAPDIVFEQEAADLATLESQMKSLTDSAEFQIWTKKISSLITDSPKREVYLVANP
jgi:hypothetical protein